MKITKITTIGIDLAKVVFQIHGVTEHGKVAVRKQLKRAEMLSYFANLEPCLIGMEACGSAHHWARKLESYGHTVKLMAPQFVKPYVKTNKNDMADAEAICEAVGRPNMYTGHFSPQPGNKLVASPAHSAHGFGVPQADDCHAKGVVRAFRARRSLGANHDSRHAQHQTSRHAAFQKTSPCH